MGSVETVVVRVWLPDRPGALGQIASRIGAVGGDVLAIEVLEAGAGRVIDELVVALPEGGRADVMVNAVHAIDGVSVEHVRPIDGVHTDSGILALSFAAELAEADPADRVDVLVAAVQRIAEADWVIASEETRVIAARGAAPPSEWVSSLVAGSRHLGGEHPASSDLFWSSLPSSGLWVGAGRADRPVHDRERIRLDLFLRVADALLASS